MAAKNAKPAETSGVSFTLIDKVKQTRETRENPYTELVTAISAEGVIDTAKGAQFTTSDKRSTVSAQLKRAGDAAGVDLRKTVVENEDGTLTFKVRAVSRESDVNGI